MRINKIDQILVIGAGGTGSILLPQLVRYLYSKKYRGQIIIADGDNYSTDNITRQQFNLQFSGINKAEYQAQALTSQIPQLEDHIEYIPEYLSKDKIEELVEEYTVVFNCVDNRAARKYVEDTCLLRDNVVHICCGNEMRTGQVQISYRRDGKQVTPSIYKESPNFNSDNDDRSNMSCEDLAKLPSGGQVIIANMMAASLALAKFIQITSDEKPFSNGEWIPAGSVFFDAGTDKFGTADEMKLEIKL